jgi:hypothetical protein
LRKAFYLIQECKKTTFYFAAGNLPPQQTGSPTIGFAAGYFIFLTKPIAHRKKGDITMVTFVTAIPRLGIPRLPPEGAPLRMFFPVLFNKRQ